MAEAFSLVMNSLKSTNSLSACFVIIQLMLDKIFNEQSTASNTNKTNELRNLLLTNYEKIFSILFEKSSSKDLNLFKKI